MGPHQNRVAESKTTQLQVRIGLLGEGPMSHTAAIRPSGLSVMVVVQGEALGTWRLQCLCLLLYVGHRLSDSKTGLLCLPGDSWLAAVI